ncbi:MAG: ABC transporter permease subunit [Streptosporangiales bacterium]|nr:ABC transporter permease subunit [Streptosporangiales bacterium]
MEPVAGARPSGGDVQARGSRQRTGVWRPWPSGWLGLGLAAPLVALLVVFAAYPVLQLMAESVASTGGTDAYVEYFRSPSAMRGLLLTLVTSLVVTVLAVVGGAMVAWTMLTAKSGLVRGMLWVATLTPMWMGVVVKNYAFTLLLGREGALNGALKLLPFVEETPTDLLYTPTAVVLGVLYSMMPFAILPLYVGLRQIDPDLVRAAEGLGASHAGAIRTVVVPLATPAFVASAVVVFVISIGFYVTPILLGGPRSAFVASRIQDDLFKYFNEPEARVASVTILVIAVAVVTLAMRVVGADRIRRAMS